jgi:plastocyanin
VKRLAIALTALAACALVPAVAGASGATRSVTVGDGYFSPSKLTVKSGTTIRWVWGSGLSYTHDVMLGRHPKGVAPFMSDYAAGDYTFKRKLTKAGTYTFLCDLHQGMKMTVVVKG